MFHEQILESRIKNQGTISFSSNFLCNKNILEQEEFILRMQGLVMDGIVKIKTDSINACNLEHHSNLYIIVDFKLR